MPEPLDTSAADAWLAQLADFLVRANAKTFAGGAKGRKSPIPGETWLSWRWKNWRIDDRYGAFVRAPGFTVVSSSGRGVWTNAYFGYGLSHSCVDKAEESFDFLRRALLAATVDCPVRGLDGFNDAKYTYLFSFINGGLSGGYWREEVVSKETYAPVFIQEGHCDLMIYRNKIANQPLYPWDFV